MSGLLAGIILSVIVLRFQFDYVHFWIIIGL